MNVTTGLILAGGQGQRMGGVDKGLQLFQGRPLVAHVLDRIAPQVDQLLISANRNPEAYAAFGHQILSDVIDGYIGPLAGLQAGLRACRTPLLATVPCDAPRLPTDLVARLRAALDLSGAPVAVACTADGVQPVFLLCHRGALSSLENFLGAGHRGVSAWAASLNATRVSFADSAAFANINTPEELQAAGPLE